MDFISWKDRKPLATTPKNMCRVLDVKAATKALTAFKAREWGPRSPAIDQSWRWVVGSKSHFPSDEAATKLLYLIFNISEKKWKVPPRQSTLPKVRFAVIFCDPFIKAMAA